MDGWACGKARIALIALPSPPVKRKKVWHILQPTLAQATVAGTREDLSHEDSRIVVSALSRMGTPCICPVAGTRKRHESHGGPARRT